MMYKIFLVYVVVINIATFAAFGLDKMFAIYKKWRISEATLTGLCALGGSIGGLIAMGIFRHKIRKPRFYIGVPLLLIIQIVVVCQAAYLL